MIVKIILTGISAFKIYEKPEEKNGSGNGIQLSGKA